MWPLDCFAALAMTGWELARLFLGISLARFRRERLSMRSVAPGKRRLEALFASEAVELGAFRRAAS